MLPPAAHRCAAAAGGPDPARRSSCVERRDLAHAGHDDRPARPPVRGRCGGPPVARSIGFADFVRALFWTLGIAATGVLFFSYYLDDTGPLARRTAAHGQSEEKAAGKPAQAKRPARRASRARPTPISSSDLLKWAKEAGADAADALYVNGESISVAQRLGKREKLESSEGRDLGLRVFVGQRQAFVSSTDFAPASLRTAGQPRRRHGRAVPEDPTCGIAPEELLATSWPDLDLDDKTRPSAKKLLAMAARSRGCRARRQGRHQLRRRRGRLGPHLGDAGRQQRLLRRLSPQRLLARPARCWAAKAPAWSATTNGRAPSISRT